MCEDVSECGEGDAESEADDCGFDVEREGAFSGEDAHSGQSHAHGHDAPEDGHEEDSNSDLHDEGHEESCFECVDVGARISNDFNYRIG